MFNEDLTRPLVLGKYHMVSAGHYKASVAGNRILQNGGNAIDATVSMIFCLNILEPHNNGIGGHVPILIYMSKEKKVYAVSGQGFAPKAATINYFQKKGIDIIPGDGYLPACVPSVIGTCAEVLARFGTMSLTEIMQPVIELLENGLPVCHRLAVHLKDNAERYYENYPTTAEIFLKNGVPKFGDIIYNHDLLKLFKEICKAEKANKHKGRISGIEAGKNLFYKGAVPEKIVEFINNNPVLDVTGEFNDGLLTVEDFHAWEPSIEEPIHYDFMGHTVYKCPPWSQGPVLLQQLALLKNFEIESFNSTSDDYIHLLVESSKLAFADREYYYGDPLFDTVPLDILLSDKYNSHRSKLITDLASNKFIPGNVFGDKKISEIYRPFNVKEDAEYARLHRRDTTHCNSIDVHGNMAGATMSGGWITSSPIVKGMGFSLDTRAQMFYLNPNRSNSLAPHKRPRTTLSPTIVLKDKKPYMVFGVEGGDQQDQWSLQFLFNHLIFKDNIQAAIDKPKFHSLHFPASFYPRSSNPCKLIIEKSYANEKIIKNLNERGHKVELVNDFSAGRIMASQIDTDRGIVLGAASPRLNMASAIGW
jgi:gamma-glutamyltranspeptidase / glutathione hydrolase